MSKYIVDDPWLEYLELPAHQRGSRQDQVKSKKALHKRMMKFRRSRRTKPFTKF